MISSLCQIFPQRLDCHWQLVNETILSQRFQLLKLFGAVEKNAASFNSEIATVSIIQFFLCVSIIQLLSLFFKLSQPGQLLYRHDSKAIFQQLDKNGKFSTYNAMQHPKLIFIRKVIFFLLRKSKT